MAMTITPAIGFTINQHSQAQTRPSLENSAALVSEKDSSGVPVNSRVANDSVELSIASENQASASSRLSDFDQAQEAMATLKNTIHAQSGLALQTQANIMPETALSLLND